MSIFVSFHAISFTYFLLTVIMREKNWNAFDIFLKFEIQNCASFSTEYTRSYI